MAVIRRIPNLKLTKDEFYKAYLSILNVLLPIGLTQTEIDVLNHLYLQGKVLTKETRKRIREGLRSGEENLNNFISKLSKKGLIVDSHGLKSINPKFLPPEYEDRTIIQLEFVNEQTDGTRVKGDEAKKERYTFPDEPRF